MEILRERSRPSRRSAPCPPRRSRAKRRASGLQLSTKAIPPTETERVARPAPTTCRESRRDDGSRCHEVAGDDVPTRYCRDDGRHHQDVDRPTATSTRPPPSGRHEGDRSRRAIGAGSRRAQKRPHEEGDRSPATTGERDGGDAPASDKPVAAAARRLARRARPPTSAAQAKSTAALAQKVAQDTAERVAAETAARVSKQYEAAIAALTSDASTRTTKRALKSVRARRRRRSGGQAPSRARDQEEAISCSGEPSVTPSPEPAPSSFHFGSLSHSSLRSSTFSRARAASSAEA